MTRISVAVLALVSVLHGANAWADPTATVTYDGVNAAGNNTWTAWISPDPALFFESPNGPGGAMGVELAFAVEGSEFVSAEWEDNIWEYENPGWNPYLPGTPPEVVTFGTWVSPDSTKVFGAYGGPIFYDAGPYQLLYFETLGSELTTIKFGQAASGHEIHGATLAQVGISTVSSGLLAEPLTRSLMASLTQAGASLDPAPIYFYGISGAVSSAPEPGSLTLLAACLGAFGLRTRGRNTRV